MRRYGPLHAAADGIVLGDPGRRHLLLDPGGLHIRNEDEPGVYHTWDDVEELTLHLPTTRFRFPGLISGILSAVLVAFIQENPNIGPEEGHASLRTRDSHDHIALDRHHLGGYWKPAVQGTQRMIDRFITDPSSRQLLHHPDKLLRAVASVRPDEERGRPSGPAPP